MPKEPDIRLKLEDVAREDDRIVSGGA